MTAPTVEPATEPERVESGPRQARPATAAVAVTTGTGAGPEAPSPEVERRAALLAALAGWCATAGAAWVLSGVFLGIGPRLLGLVAATVGPVAVALSLRTTRGTAVQVAGIGAGVVLAVVAGLVGRSGSESVPQLVVDALRSGGLAQAPVAFDPGWRVLLVLVVVLLGVASAGLAVAARRPRLAVAVCAPVVAAGTLVQPASSEVVSAAVALGFVVAGLGVSAAADLVREGASSGRFELRRAGRGAGLLALLIAALLGASQVGVLLPPPKEDVVVPPQRPQPSPPLSDRELFAVSADRPLPWRLGTLDVYDGEAWLTPPYDPGSFEALGAGGAVATPAAPSPAETVEAVFEVEALTGRALPALANPVRVEGGGDVQIDPRTQVLRVPPGRSPAGRTYTVVAAAPPTGAQLAEAPEPGAELQEFLEVPPAPPEVAALLEALPDASDFDRLQAAREAYYSAVVAAGAGDPADVTPSRVAEMLAGQEATPFEITAGEAILARWVGVPSRLGYGWFGGDTADDGQRVLRPKHGATWLEVWFEGHGWVPIVGKPPRAKSSLSKGAKDDDPSVRPTERLTVFTYVPVRLQGLRQVATVVAYWALRIVPLLLLLVVGVVLAPAVRKWRRRRVRRRGAEGGGPPARLEAAYAELRDLLTDLDVTRPSVTPLEALATVDPDPEHTELAWLVTRGLWGDLRRDLDDADARIAEDLAVSVRRRLGQAQPLGVRFAAAVSRASLREPWGEPAPAPRPRPVGRGRRPRWSLPAWPRRTWLAAGAVAAAVAVVLVAVSWPGEREPAAVGPPGDAPLAPLPDPLVPDRLGDVELRRERGAEEAYARAGRSSLIAAGRVYSVRVGDAVEGSLQAAVLRADVADRGDEVVADVLRSLGGGGFEPARFGRERGYQLVLPEQRVLLWFTPDLRAYQLFVARTSFTRANEVFGALLAEQRGGAVEGPPIPIPDPRRGLG